MRHGCRLLLTFACVAVLGGCMTQRRATFVEARDSHYRDALTEFLRTEKNGLTSNDRQAVVVSSSEVQRIVLGRLTGGIDRDGVPGDEVLSVVIEPQDHFAKPLQVAGSVQISAVHDNEVLATWSVAEEKFAQHWKQGLLNVGYHLELPWPKPPGREQIRIVARVTAADGRTYEATKDLRIALAPNAVRPAAAQAAAPQVQVGTQTISLGKPMPFQPAQAAVVTPPPVAPPPLLP